MSLKLTAAGLLLTGAAVATVLERPALPSPVPQAEAAPGADTAKARAFLDAVSAADPVLCDLALRTVGMGWYWSGEELVPDRDQTSTELTRWASRRVRDPVAVGILASAFRSGTPCSRRAAARLLGRSGVEEAERVLLDGLRDQDPNVRRLAAVGLGFAEDPGADRVLVQALADRDPQVRAAVAWAIGSRH